MLAIHSVVNLLLLAGLSVAYNHAARRVERLRRAVTENRVPNMLGVWIFASIMLLPTLLVPVALGIFYAADWPNRSAARRAHPWRYVYSWAASTVAALAAVAALHQFGMVPGTALALVIFTAVNIGLISLAMVIRHQTSVAIEMLSQRRSHMLEVATQLTGVVLGAGMQWHPAAAVTAVPILIATHYRALRISVRETQAYDPEARLWSEDAWAFRASELVATGKVVTVMIIDPGTSDRAVLADVIRPCLTGGSVLGRYGKAGIASASRTSALIVGQATVQAAAAALARSGARAHLGGRTAAGEDLTEMLTHALSDLMTARDRAQVQR